MEKARPSKKLSLTSLVVCLAVLLILVQLVISHNLATQGERFRQLEQQALNLEQENIIFAEEINKAGSLSRIDQEAKKLGFSRASQVLHLTPQIPVALGKSDLPKGR